MAQDIVQVVAQYVVQAVAQGYLYRMMLRRL
jgi:hypothetical protein